MKDNIVVVSPGRFGSFDLAEQLQRSGRLAAIYSGYPRFKLRNTGVLPQYIHTFPWIQTPYQALWRIGGVPRSILRELAWQSVKWIDAYAAHTLPECGLVSALSSVGLKTGTEIKRRGGVYVCDRGSTHILWQKRILDQEYDTVGLPWDGVDHRFLKRELAEYALADGITLGSRFSLRTFIEEGVSPKKLYLANHGVNLSIYHRTAERAPNFRVLFAGLPIVRKGVHHLLQAFRKASLPGAELVFVGPTSPERDFLLQRYPTDNVVIRGFLSREELVEEMSRASVLVLPSIEDGFGLVIVQALACGCPVIASRNTGAEDIYEDGKEGFIIPPRDVDALADRLTQLYRDSALLESMSEAALNCVEKLGGWDSYGRVIQGIFDELLAANRAN